MVVKAFHTDALEDLCSKDQLDLLDSIDGLRSQGISHYVSLPQIIVCGDQSSGKSSVLEAISGVSFPVKSNLCTRFPTELVLRKTSHIGVTVSIVPHQSRDESEKLALSRFHEKLEDFDGLSNLIENAKAAMAISTHGRAFSKDLLRIEVSGPDRPHLTIVDLPGLIHSETKQQSASDVELVQDVVQAYMREPRSIILAVVSAKNDYANQIVLKLARAADKNGIRTLGIITKPDTLVAGSESEAMYISLARNQDVEFRLGWHVLKNMDSETGVWSLFDRDAQEDLFFSQGIWKELSRQIMGIEKLRKRLSKVLLQQIATELPSLMNEIESKSSSCRSQLDKLGEPRATLNEQRLYLLHISQSFHSLVKASVDGTYNDSFFGDADSEPGYQKRIRAVAQNLNLDFAERMAKGGHRREIVNFPDDAVLHRGVTGVTKEGFLDHIQHLMRRSRGRELPGTFNPLIVADLFLEQSSPWEAIARSHVEKVWKTAKQFLALTVNYIADSTTAKALLQRIFEPSLSQLLDTLHAKTTELLRPHQKSHPITYNHYFTESLQKVRNERSNDECTRILKSFFRVDSLDSVYVHQKDLRPLVTALVHRTEPDINRFACSEALDCMKAYYKVALKRFIDDIAIEVIEAKLISSLYDIFSPVSVTAMPVDTVAEVAGESEENRAYREQLTQQLHVLTKGSETCQRFMGMGGTGADERSNRKSLWMNLIQQQPSLDGAESADAASELRSRSLSNGSLPYRSSPESVLSRDEAVPKDPLPADIQEACPEPEAPPTPVLYEDAKPSSKKAKKDKKRPSKAASAETSSLFDQW
ncbi:putative vacuolar sorting protein VPS1 [Coleophoma cylindrospora]|uniref:Putative vacuolar sorting protein VPS1 n=1 Tax=Coleophoma cylindrospora TaxID=1849047 RepID=A0A3D8QP18_9HELO|nr:putative vacuolar sorting protein VPS1 [Coleophoma cylindrospora]